MPAAVPSIGLGVTISIAATAEAQVRSISGPSPSVGQVETTALSSTWKTFLPTLPDGGEFSFVISYDPLDTGHQGLQTLVGTPAAVACVLTLHNSKTVSFSAFLTKLEISGLSPEEVISATVGFKVTGAMVFA